MSDDASSIAAEFKKAAAGLQVGSIEVWGIMTIRPGDTIYDVASVKAEAGRLEVGLKHRSGQIMKLSIWSPAGFTHAGSELVIQSATRVQAEGGLDVELAGGQLEVRGTDGKKSHRKLPKKTPALALR
jgi:hypothetical protein